MVPSKRHPLWAERQFGRGVGAILTLIGAWLTWSRPPSTVAVAVLSVGLLLLVLGFVFPRALVWPNRGWMRMAEGLSFVSTRVVLGLVFFGAVMPTGFVKRLTGWDPLGRRRQSAGSYWVSYPERQRDRTHFEKMF